MKIAKLFLAAVVAAVLAGCASTAPLPAAPAKHSVSGFATLAESGTFEFEAAPTLTRLATVFHNAARMVDDKRISATIAATIRARSGYARTMLSDALATHKADPVRARELLAKAQGEVAFCELLLPKGRP